MLLIIQPFGTGAFPPELALIHQDHQLPIQTSEGIPNGASDFEKTPTPYTTDDPRKGEKAYHRNQCKS